MGYHTSNAALAYDMTAAPAYRDTPQAPAAPRERQTPRFDVYTGAGRQANQGVSPVFMGVIKVFCIVAAVFVAIGVARVTLAGVTASLLDSNAALTETLEKDTSESSDLEVMHSVYGADTRIRDLAGTYGMTEPTDSVTLDFSQGATSANGAATSNSAAQ